MILVYTGVLLLETDVIKFYFADSFKVKASYHVGSDTLFKYINKRARNADFLLFFYLKKDLFTSEKSLFFYYY